MSRFVALAALVLACMSGRVRAAERAPLDEAIARAVQAELPAGLRVGRVSPPVLDAGDAALSLHFPSAPRPGWAAVLVVARRGEREIGRGWARVELVSLVRVAVARRAIPAGERLREGDFVVTERAGAAEHAAPESLAGHAVARPIAAGEVIAPDDLAAEAPTARGQTVRVIVRRGGVVIAVSGVLERAAAPGERSAARIVPGARLVAGRMIDAHTLENDGDLP